MAENNNVALIEIAKKAGISVEQLLGDLKSGGLTVKEKPAAQFAAERASTHKDIVDVLDSFYDEYLKEVFEGKDGDGTVVRKRITLSGKWGSRTFNMADGNTTDQLDIICIIGGANYGKNGKKKEE